MKSPAVRVLRSKVLTAKLGSLRALRTLSLMDSEIPVPPPSSNSTWSLPEVSRSVGRNHISQLAVVPEDNPDTLEREAMLLPSPGVENSAPRVLSALVVPLPGKM